MRLCILSLSVLTVCVVLGAARPARGELTPDQVAIIAMADSQPSRELAEYYAKARGIPESHILLLKGEMKQRIARYYWNETVRPAILSWLKGHESFGKILCLVTIWDVPLEISPLNPNASEITERVKYLRQVRANLIGQAGTLLQMLDSVTGQTAAPAAASLPADIKIEDLYARFNKSMQPAQAWLQSAQTPAEKQKAGAFIDRVLVTIGGNQGLVRLVTPRTNVTLSAERAMRLGYLRGRSEGLRQGLQSLSLLGDSVARDEQCVELSQALGGLFGAIQWIDQQQYLMKQNFTGASFDSELSLVLWQEQPVLSWIPNPWHYSFDLSPGRRRTTLLVSRLSAPEPQTVKRMIDDAIAAEKSSPAGVAYVDARGLAPGPNSSGQDLFLQYDQSLRDLAARLEKHASITVVPDNQPDVFAKGSCERAALYCGWHSPNNYVDAFEWSTGAVGYHLASLEASWLQFNDDDRVQRKTPWCPTMLLAGASATVGSCREAYLSAFPLPDDFFSLLLTGKYTLVEVYYRACPFVSWTTLLVGDPLYNPYKRSPKLPETALPERMNPAASGKARETGTAGPPGSGAPEVVTPAPSEEASPSEGGIVLPGLDS